MKGSNGHICRIVCAYQPCGKTTTSTMGLGTLYSQKRRYQIEKGETRRPRILLNLDLLW